MNFVGIGVNPLWFMASIIGGLTLYLFYLWGLWRILTKIRQSRQLLVYAILLDIVLGILSLDLGRWLWIWPLRPPIPVSAFCALMLFAFVNLPKVADERPTLE